MKTRLFYHKSSLRWLHRLDTDLPITAAEAKAAAVQAFGIPYEDIVTFTTEATLDLDGLRTANGWAGTPPSLPKPSDTPTEALIRPTPPTPTPTAYDNAILALEAATTLQAAKTAIRAALTELRHGA